MARICGYSGSSLAADAAAETARNMAAIVGTDLNPGTATANGAAMLTSGDRRVDFFADAGRQITAAIDGEPRWRDAELASVAERDGHAAALVQAWERYGERLFERLAGSFALAVVDVRTDEVLLGVDRMGIRPLCFARTADNGIAFGTSTTAALCHPGVDASLCPQAIYEYVYFHVIPSPRTIFSAVSKLEPAQCVHLRAGQMSISRYWSPTFHASTRVAATDLQDALMDCMRESVDRGGMGPGTGCFLSGGLDSSTVCGLASGLSAAPVRAFSIGFDQPGYDEIAFARIAAEHFSLELTEYYVTPDDVADAIGVIATSYDEPFGNSSAIPAYFCARVAKDHGITRLLAGDGGDELFAGNERYAKQKVFDHYGRVPGWLRHGLVEPLLSRRAAGLTALTRKASRYIEQARIPMPERLETYNLLHVRSPAEVFSPAFLDTVRPQATLEQMRAWYAQCADAGLVDRMLHYDWKVTLADNDLRKVNRMCEVAGIEVAFPMLDDELVELSTRIPARLKLPNGKLRHFFKQTVRDFLPATIIDKKKHGFGLPVGEWASAPGRLQDHVMASLAGLNARGILHPDFVAQLVASHRTEHAAYYGNFLWVLAMLEDWLAARKHST